MIALLKVLVTPRSFGKYSKEPYDHLKEAGIEVVKNLTNGILKKEQLKDLVKDVSGVIAGIDPFDLEVLKAAPQLVGISKYGVGTDNIDLKYCKQAGIEVTITKGANSHAVADYAFSLMLAAARRVVEIDRGCHIGDWSKKVSKDIFGKKIGVLGLGAIGKGVIERAKGFQMDLYGYDIYRDETFIKENQIHFVSVKEIFKECDFISIHLPLTKETKHLVDENMLNLAKPNLVLVNTARGGIIDEEALYHMLKAGKLLGVGLDVFEHEPAAESPLLTLPNVIVGSHTAASTIGTVDQMSKIAVDNIIRIFQEKGLI